MVIDISMPLSGVPFYLTVNSGGPHCPTASPAPPRGPGLSGTPARRHQSWSPGWPPPTWTRILWWPHRQSPTSMIATTPSGAEMLDITPRSPNTISSSGGDELPLLWPFISPAAASRPVLIEPQGHPQARRHALSRRGQHPQLTNHPSRHLPRSKGGATIVAPNGRSSCRRRGHSSGDLAEAGPSARPHPAPVTTSLMGWAFRDAPSP